MKGLCFILFLLIGIKSVAQDVPFLVYHTKGAITTTKKPSLKRGDKLNASEFLSVPAGGEIVLLCKNYTTLKLAAKGRYAVSELVKRCTSAKPSFTASYFKYVWDEISHPHGAPEKNPSQYMRNSGAVSRGCPALDFRLPVDTIIYAGGDLPLHFETTFSEPSFSIYTDPEEGEPLLTSPLKAKQIQLSAFKSPLQKPGFYYWEVTGNDGERCERSVIKVISKAEMNTMSQTFVQAIVLPSAAETAFARAFVLEENGLLAEAHIYYKLAHQLAPKNKIYQASYNRYYE